MFSGGLPYFLRNAATKAFEPGVELVVPDRRPDAARLPSPRPGVRGVQVEARDRVRQAELGVLLDEVVTWLPRGWSATSRLRLADLEQERTEVGGVDVRSSSPMTVPPLATTNALAALARVVAEQVVEVRGKMRLPLIRPSRASAWPAAFTIT